jgi:hypothetical protein
MLGDSDGWYGVSSRFLLLWGYSVQWVVHVCGSGHGNCSPLSFLSWDYILLCLCMWVAVIVMAFTFPFLRLSTIWN